MLDVIKLLDLMKEKEIHTLKELSDCTMIPYTTLSYMKTGHDMFVSTLVELAKFFNVPVDYLIKKSYGIVTLNDRGMTFYDSTSYLEVEMLGE